MRKPMIIGLTGYKRSGKTTVATLLAERGWQVESFAAPIRRAVADLLGMTQTQLDDSKSDPVAWLDGLTPRALMQTLGTEWGRARHPDLWVRALLGRISVAELPAGVALQWVIHDVRFVNEAEFIRGLGGVVVRVDRPALRSYDPHDSEIPLPRRLVDYELPNHGDATALAFELDALLARIGADRP